MSEIEKLNNSVWCKLGVSPIHGVGVFAIRDIPRGTKLSDSFHIYRLTKEEFSHVLPEIQEVILDRVCFNEGNISFLSPNNYQFLQSFMNHSYIPNSDGYKSLFNIKKGEEITEDYRKLVGKMHQLSRKHYKFL